MDRLLTEQEYYEKRKEHYAANPPPGPLHRFDSRIHYPFRGASQPSVPDIVYRTVPVGTSTRRQLSYSVVTNAGAPPAELVMDVGAGVPQRPIVRDLYVDCASGLPIGKILIFAVFVKSLIIILFLFKFCFFIVNDVPQVPQSPTTGMGQHINF